MAGDLTKPDESFGPAMLECSPREREFVHFVMEGKPFAEAARLAGCGTADSSANTLARIGYRYSHRERVINAIAEESKKMVRTTLPQAVKAVREIVSSPHHRDRAKVALNLIEKIDPTVQRQQVDVNVKVDHRQDALDELRALKALQVPREKLEELFGYSGLPLLERQLAAQNANKPIDAEFSEVLADPDANILGD